MRKTISAAMCLAAVLGATGCMVRLGPKPVELARATNPPVLRLGKITEDLTGTWAQAAKANNWGGRNIASAMLRQSPAASLFSTDPANLAMDIHMVSDHEDDGPRLAFLALMSICTLGIVPLNYHSEWTSDVVVTIRTPSGAVVAEYPIQAKGTYEILALPLTMFSLGTAALRGPQDGAEVRRRMTNNAVADIMKAIEGDYPRLAQARASSAIVSPPVQPPVEKTPAATEALPPIAQRWAVLVGVSDYLHAGVGGLTNLRYAARDAQQLYEGLVGTAPGLWPKQNVRLLTDKEATERAVREAILNFLQKAQRDDLVLLFFSGHGAPDPARPKNNYFLCHDTDPRKLATTGFPMWEIQNALERGIIEARRVVVLADACHSGGFAPEGIKDIRVVSRSVAEGVQAIAKGATCRVVTSCEPGEVSQENADWGQGHGAFAYALAKGLGGAADSPADKNARGNADGKVELDELVHYLRREVGDLTHNAQHVQDSGSLNAVLIQK